MAAERDTKHANDVVTLSVGGKEFVTYFGTLANSRSPYFEYMFQVDRYSGRIIINYANIIVSKYYSHSKIIQRLLQLIIIDYLKNFTS